MPRRKTEQPAPLERFHLPDGTEVSIVDKTCWPVGRGQHAARDFEIKRMEPIIEKIVDIYMKPNGPKEVEEILYSASKFCPLFISYGSVWRRWKRRHKCSKILVQKNKFPTPNLYILHKKYCP